LEANAFDEFITAWAEKETDASYYAINGKKAGTYTRRLGEYGYNVWKFKAR
jgi:hypothetical protein